MDLWLKRFRPLQRERNDHLLTAVSEGDITDPHNFLSCSKTEHEAARPSVTESLPVGPVLLQSMNTAPSHVGMLRPIHDRSFAFVPYQALILRVHVGRNTQGCLRILFGQRYLDINSSPQIAKVHSHD